MTEILIVSKTTMRTGVCVGAHRLDNFASLRLHRPEADNQPVDTPLAVGDVWSVEIEPAPRTPPHVEDVRVKLGNRERRIDDLADEILDRGMIWRGSPDDLYGGHLASTNSGSGYVPAAGDQPDSSTGYWIPDEILVRDDYEEGKPKFRHVGPSSVMRAPWVGVALAPDEIPAGTLVRVSLSRPYSAAGVEGCWLQISGVY